MTTNNDRLIRIKALSGLFTIDEIVKEKNAERRLITIRNMFHLSNSARKGELKVITSVVNPTLF